MQVLSSYKCLLNPKIYIDGITTAEIKLRVLNTYLFVNISLTELNVAEQMNNTNIITAKIEIFFILPLLPNDFAMQQKISDIAVNTAVVESDR